MRVENDSSPSFPTLYNIVAQPFSRVNRARSHDENDDGAAAAAVETWSYDDY